MQTFVLYMCTHMGVRHCVRVCVYGGGDNLKTKNPALSTQDICVSEPSHVVSQKILFY